MTITTTQSADVFGQSDELKRLCALRDEFVFMGNREHLFHATRIMVNPDSEEGGDLERGWEEFVTDRDTFGYSAFRQGHPSKRVQHHCFYGCAALLNQFTGLAAQAALEIPMSFLPQISPNPKDREARRDRDMWMLGIYRIAYRQPGLIPVSRDVQRNGEGEVKQIDRGFFDPLGPIANYDASEAHGYSRWTQSFSTTGEPRPRYLYATLSLDVCRCSVVLIDHLVTTWNLNRFRSLPTNICDVEIVPMEECQDVAADESDNCAACLGIDFDVETGKLSRAGYRDEQGKLKKVLLSPIHRLMFFKLLRASGTTVPFDTLAQGWPYPPGSNRDAKIYTEKRRLCKKIGCLDLLIENDRACGYKLIDASHARTPSRRSRSL